MAQMRYKYTILKNMDGKYWLWFDERGTMVGDKYVPNLHPYHEIITSQTLREGAEIWTDELVSVPEACQLRPLGEYSDNYKVRARIKDESKFVDAGQAPAPSVHHANPGKKPGRG